MAKIQAVVLISVLLTIAFLPTVQAQSATQADLTALEGRLNNKIGNLTAQATATQVKLNAALSTLASIGNVTTQMRATIQTGALNATAVMALLNKIAVDANRTRSESFADHLDIYGAATTVYDEQQHLREDFEALNQSNQEGFETSAEETRETFLIADYAFNRLTVLTWLTAFLCFTNVVLLAFAVRPKWLVRRIAREMAKAEDPDKANYVYKPDGRGGGATEKADETCPKEGEGMAFGEYYKPCQFRDSCPVGGYCKAAGLDAKLQGAKDARAEQEVEDEADAADPLLAEPTNGHNGHDKANGHIKVDLTEKKPRRDRLTGFGA